MQILTFGYAGRGVSDLQAHVKTHNAVVIDTRFMPFSRGTPEWNRSALETAFGEKYRWLKAFGNVNYKGGPIRIDDYATGLIHLSRFLKPGESPILLCVCGRVDQCHRSHVARMLSVDLGGDVLHLDQKAKPLVTGSLF